MKTITICSSANFYKHVVEIEDELVARGFEVIIPISARKMKAKNDFDVEKNRSWLTKPDDYHIKTAYMRGHFEEIEKADAILVVNDEKNGKAGYIGANVLMEMALAFWLKLPIYVLNPIEPDTPYVEEVIAMEAVILNGDFSKIRI